jgi:CO/xanthine dehydrogenase Mo-binding subunit
VAAVAAISSDIADEALSRIVVTYEVLPHVIDVEEAMAPTRPLLHDHIFTGARGEAGQAQQRRPAHRFVAATWPRLRRRPT